MESLHLTSNSKGTEKVTGRWVGSLGTSQLPPRLWVNF